MVGLFFFIRASTKDRIEQLRLIAEEPQASLLPKIQQYFEQRAYKIKEVDADKSQVTFQGFVKPSWFLAIFLTTLAACGFFCLALVLSFLYPAWGNFFLVLVLFAPVAGIFYWRKSGRLEEVSLQWEATDAAPASSQSIITVTAHRDELTQLRQSLPLKPAQ